MRSTNIKESRTIAGRFRGGKLAPVMAVGFKGNEGGMLSQTAIIELDPVAGRLITPVTGQMFAVYVPVQAMAALKNPFLISRERKSGQQTRHRPKGRALDYSQLPARAPEANSANAEAGKIVA